MIRPEKSSRILSKKDDFRVNIKLNSVFIGTNCETQFDHCASEPCGKDSKGQADFDWVPVVVVLSVLLLATIVLILAMFVSFLLLRR